LASDGCVRHRFLFPYTAHIQRRERGRIPIVKNAKVEQVIAEGLSSTGERKSKKEKKSARARPPVRNSLDTASQIERIVPTSWTTHYIKGVEKISETLILLKRNDFPSIFTPTLKLHL